MSSVAQRSRLDISSSSSSSSSSVSLLGRFGLFFVVVLSMVSWSSRVAAFVPAVTTSSGGRIGISSMLLRRYEGFPTVMTTLATSSTSSSHHRSYSSRSLSARSINDDVDNDVAPTTTTTTTTTKMINLHTIRKEELATILQSWGYPKYRANQIWSWVRNQGVESIDDMKNIPKKLRSELKKHSTLTSLELDCELISKDGTRKRAYKLWDGQLIESVLMPYKDGRYTACISSQAGCAQGCVFCATGQMGFSRQLTPEEIFEQVSRFAAELAQDNHRLSNVVFMGMGEPMANYKNVVEAIHRIQDDIGIGARKITVSTVGLVPNIRKLMIDLPQVRLAVSLHCANDDERSALLPANVRNGGLATLMNTLKEYIDTTGRRITLEWALIEGENDTPETAHELGSLLVKKHSFRRDMIHINVIPLNPTGGYGGNPSATGRVNEFVQILEKQYGIACTPRVRRGIDINAGCGQLKAEVEKRKRNEEEGKGEQQQQPSAGEPELKDFLPTNTDSLKSAPSPPIIGVYDDDDEDDDELATMTPLSTSSMVEEFAVDDSVVDFDNEEQEEWEDYVYTSEEEKSEADRLLSLVQNTILTSDNAVIRSNDEYQRKEQQQQQQKVDKKSKKSP